MILKRKIYGEIKKFMFKGRIMILYGPRQVGKTTLLGTLSKEFPGSIYLNCDQFDIRERLTNTTSTELAVLFEGKKIILIDEAQRVQNIGITLKLVADTMKGIQIVAFELKNEFGNLELYRLLEDMMIFGNYPVARLMPIQEPREEVLYDIASSYVYKDILQLEKIKYPEKLEKLLRALAHQIGSEVSYTELASLCELSKTTVEDYIRILEQAYIIFRLEPYTKNRRRSLKRLRKIYFWDLGIRNALIKDFRPLSLRNETGELFENFFIAERMKKNLTESKLFSAHFWRAYDGEEIDFIEERAGELAAYECKWKKKVDTVSKSKDAPVDTCTVIHQENVMEYL